MAIKNQDGTPYKLQGVNPLMKTQNVADEKYILHNFSLENKPVLNLEIEEQPDNFDDIKKKTIGQIKQEPIFHKFNCLPMHTRISKDNFYGEEKTESKFSQPIKVKGYVHSSSSELIWQFWSQTILEKDSVIFEHTEKRWWQVQTMSQHDKWFCYNCVPSSVTPSF